MTGLVNTDYKNIPVKEYRRKIEFLIIEGKIFKGKWLLQDNCYLESKLYDFPRL